MSRKVTALPATRAGPGRCRVGPLHQPGVVRADHQVGVPAQHPSALYTNGSIETVLGLSFASRQTRSLGAVGIIGYLAYLGGSAIRQSRKH